MAIRELLSPKKVPQMPVEVEVQASRHHGVIETDTAVSETSSLLRVWYIFIDVLFWGIVSHHFQSYLLEIISQIFGIWVMFN